MGFHGFTEPNKKPPQAVPVGAEYAKKYAMLTLGSPLRHARSLLQHDLQQFDF